MKFVGLSPAQREAFEKHREAFNEGRQQRVDARKKASLGTRNTPEGMIGDCVIQSLIIFSPICIVVVPLALAMAHSVEGPKASSRESYLPSLPSDLELSRLDEKIRQRLNADSLVRRLSGAVQLDERAISDDSQPRLLIRLQSATFTPDRMIVISVVVKAEPAASVIWPPTEHRYHLGYSGDEESLVRGLAEAEANLTYSILSTYCTTCARERQIETIDTPLHL